MLYQSLTILIYHDCIKLQQLTENNDLIGSTFSLIFLDIFAQNNSKSSFRMHGNFRVANHIFQEITWKEKHISYFILEFLVLCNLFQTL